MDIFWSCTLSKVCKSNKSRRVMNFHEFYSCNQSFRLPYHCVTFHLNGSAVYTHQGWVVREPVNTNPGLNVNHFLA